MSTNAIYPGYTRSAAHELSHAIGFDHTNDRSSLMGASSFFGDNDKATPDDALCGYLKYKRLGGHELDDTKDSD